MNYNMRKKDDRRDDSVVKGEVVDLLEKKYNILCVFEDRKRVVDMWVKREYMGIRLWSNKRRFLDVLS